VDFKCIIIVYDFCSINIFVIFVLFTHSTVTAESWGHIIINNYIVYGTRNMEHGTWVLGTETFVSCAHNIDKNESFLLK